MDTPRKKYFIVAMDPVAFLASHWLAFALTQGVQAASAPVVALSAAAKFLVFSSCGVYRFVYKYASAEDSIKVLTGNIAFLILACASVSLVSPGGPGPEFSKVPTVRFFALEFFVSFVFLMIPRYFLYFRREFTYRYKPADLTRNALIYGAGKCGEMIAWEMIRRRDLGYLPVGFIDDNPATHGQKIHGVTVLGGGDILAEAISEHRVQEIILAIPEVPGNVIRRIFDVASEKKVKFYTVPGLSEIIKKEPVFSDVRKFKVDDLLRRPQCTIDLAGITTIVSGKTILITGAGGSIGSEIAFQLMRFKPKRMVLLGRGENSVHEILTKLKLEGVPEIELVPLIADIRDRERLFSVMKRFAPDTVFHAAAHKHVYLMEKYPEEAVVNNVGGTMNLYDAAAAAGCRNFTLISTDKAVEPSSVMGMTKRICEEFLMYYCSKKIENCSIVRFGNVLGSRGSVIHKFISQIKAGGPVTITHPEVTRYFMTVPEAAKLVIQASAFARGTNLFYLDMGDPIKIADLARDLIRMLGKKPDEEIKLEFTGLLGGEKMHEKLYEDTDKVEKTVNEDILVLTPAFFYCESIAFIEKLLEIARSGNAEGLDAQFKNLFSKAKIDSGA